MSAGKTATKYDRFELFAGYGYSARAAERDRQPFEGVNRAPMVNERVEVGGHYLIVVGYTTGGVRVSCPDCRLDITFLGKRQAAETGEAVARDVVGRALAPFADKSCDGVRMHLLAAAVMES